MHAGGAYLRSGPAPSRRLAQQAAGIVREGRRDRAVRAGFRLVPAGEVGAVEELFLADDSRQQLERAVVVQVRVEPQPPQRLLEGALLFHRLSRPGTLHSGLRQAAGEERDGAATMADPDIELGMALEHAAENQIGDGDGLLRREADDEIEVEALEAGIARRTVDPGRGRMQE